MNELLEQLADNLQQQLEAANDDRDEALREVERLTVDDQDEEIDSAPFPASGTG